MNKLDSVVTNRSICPVHHYFWGSRNTWMKETTDARSCYEKVKHLWTRLLFLALVTAGRTFWMLPFPIWAISLLLFFVISYLLNLTITVRTLCLAPKVLAKLSERYLGTDCRNSDGVGPAELYIVSKRTIALNKYDAAIRKGLTWRLVKLLHGDG